MKTSFFKRLNSPMAAGAAALWLALALLPAVANAQTKIKLVMPWKWSGNMAWYLMAQDKGYFKAEGLDVEIDQGEGSAASIPKVAAGTYDAGVGDVNAVIDLAAKRPEVAPVVVYMVSNVPPFTIAVMKDSPIKTPKDLEGKTVGGPATDAALKLFPAFAKVTGIDASKVKISNMAPNLREQMLQRGQVDAAFGFVSTIYFSAKLVGIDPEKDLRFMNYSDHGLDFYSNGIFFSRAFIKDNPKAVQGFLKAVNRAIKEVVASPEQGIEYLVKREPLVNRKVELERLVFAIKNDMSHPEIIKIGLGDIDDARFKRAITKLVEINELPRTPAVGDVFDRRFLPPRAERPSGL